MYYILDTYNTSNSINYSLLECKRLPKDKAMLQFRKEAQVKLGVQRLPPREYRYFRYLIPKNIYTKQQEKNGLVEDKCLIGRFLPDIIAVLFGFRETVDSLIPRVPTQVVRLPMFVNRIIAPRGIYTLKTVRLVESLSVLKVVKLVEELEKDLESESGSESESESGTR